MLVTPLRRGFGGVGMGAFVAHPNASAADALATGGAGVDGFCPNGRGLRGGESPLWGSPYGDRCGGVAHVVPTGAVVGRGVADCGELSPSRKLSCERILM